MLQFTRKLELKLQVERKENANCAIKLSLIPPILVTVWPEHRFIAQHGGNIYNTMLSRTLRHKRTRLSTHMFLMKSWIEHEQITQLVRLPVSIPTWRRWISFNQSSDHSDNRLNWGLTSNEWIYCGSSFINVFAPQNAVLWQLVMTEISCNVR